MEAQRRLPALTNMTYKDGLGVKKKKRQVASVEWLEGPNQKAS